jgi:hypothetical protein
MQVNLPNLKEIVISRSRSLVYLPSSDIQNMIKNSRVGGIVKSSPIVLIQP